MTTPAIILEIHAPEGEIIASTPINDGAKRVVKLGGEDQVTLPLVINHPVNFRIGSYVDVPGCGHFIIGDKQRPKYDPETGAFEYELKFEAPYRLWRNKIVFFNSVSAAREAAFSLTATPDIHLGIILDNLDRYGITYYATGEKYVFDIDESVASEEAKCIEYNATSILDALYSFADEWECDVWVTENIIHLGRCEHSSAFKIEPGINAEEVQSSESKSDFANRLYVFGSDRNLPVNYRSTAKTEIAVNGIVQKRLMLPEDTPFIDARPGLRPDEIVEAVVVIDSVYPGTQSPITKVRQYIKTIEDSDPATDEMIEREETFYAFSVDNFTFSEDYLLPTTELAVRFDSGRLAGMEFQLVFNPDKEPETLADGQANPEAQWFEIVRSDSNGATLPSEPLIPAEGDKVVIYGWDATKLPGTSLITDAEAELLKKGREKAVLMARDPSTYTCPMMSDFIFAQGEYIPDTDLFLFPYTPGHRVSIQTPSGEYRESRVIGIEYPLDIPYDTPILTVGETAAYSRLGDLQEQIDAITLAGRTFQSTGNGSGIYVISTSDTTRPTDRNVYSALRAQKEFLSKTRDDSTPHNLTSRKTVTGEKGVQGSPRFQQGPIAGLGFGGQMWFDPTTGKTIVEADILRAREAMEAPEFRFNRIDVVAGEQWRTFAFGTVKDVHPAPGGLTGWLTIDLLDGEIITFKPGDILRGLFHGISLDRRPDPANASGDADTDSCGFPVYSGFSTAYLTPTAMVTAEGVETDTPALAAGFAYTLRPGSASPRSGMNLVAYGSFTDPSRRSTTWDSRVRLIMMEGVNTWSIDPDRHYTYIRGLLDGITIAGNRLSGHGVMAGRMYLYNPTISFSRDRGNAFKGADAYSVHLSDAVGILRLRSNGTAEPLLFPHWLAADTTGTGSGSVEGLHGLTAYGGSQALIAHAPLLHTSVIAHRGGSQLLWTDSIPSEGTFTATISAVGCRASIAGGYVRVTEVTDTTPGSAYVNISVNCEGEVVIDRTFTIAIVSDGTTPDWKSYVYAPAGADGGAPCRPYSRTPYPWEDGDELWRDAPDSSAEVWFMSVASVNGPTGLVYPDPSGNGLWSDPVKCTGEDGKDGRYTDFMYAVTEEQEQDSQPLYNPDTRNPNKGIIPGPWRENPPQVPEGGALWMTKAEVNGDSSTDTFTDSNGLTKTGTLLSPWSAPVRISGEKGQPGKDGKEGKSALTLILDNPYDKILIDPTTGAFAISPKFHPDTEAHLFHGSDEIEIADLSILTINGETVEKSSLGSGYNGNYYYYPGIDFWANTKSDGVTWVIRTYEGDDPSELPEKLTIRLLAVAKEDPSLTATAEWILAREEGTCIWRIILRSPAVVVDYNMDNEPLYVSGIQTIEGEPFVGCDIQRVDFDGLTTLTELPDDVELICTVRYRDDEGHTEVLDTYMPFQGAGFGINIDQDPDENVAGIDFELRRTLSDGSTEMLDRATVAMIYGGKTGRGLPGCMIRRWKSITEGQVFRNDSSKTEPGTSDQERSGYVDFLMFRVPENIAASGWLVFRCKKEWTYAGDTSPLNLAVTGTTPDTAATAAMTLIGLDGYPNNYWEEVDINEASAFFNFLIANHADIDILSGTQFLIRDDSNNVVAGLQGCRKTNSSGEHLPIFWAGAESKDMASAPVRIYATAPVTDEDGNTAPATGRAVINGEITAGDPEGQHVHINPDEKSVNIFDEQGVRRTTLTGLPISSSSDTVNGVEINPSSGYGNYTSLTDGGSVEVLGTGSFNTDGIINLEVSLSGSVTLRNTVNATASPRAYGDEQIISSQITSVGYATVMAEVYETAPGGDYGTTRKRIYRGYLWGVSHDQSYGFEDKTYYAPGSTKKISFSARAGCSYTVEVSLSGEIVSHGLSSSAAFMAENNSYAAVFGSNGFMLRKGPDTFAAMVAAVTDPGNGQTDDRLVTLRNGIMQPYTIFAAEINYAERTMTILCGSAYNIEWIGTGSMSFYIPDKYSNAPMIINATPSKYGSSANVRRNLGYIQPMLTSGGSFTDDGIIYLEIKTI